MNAIEWARRYVYFWQSSPISGAFDLRKYPLLGDPLLDLSNIRTKTTVWYGPTQSVKSVGLEIATGYRLDMLRKSILFVAQSDDDAKDFAQVKLNPFLKRIPQLVATLKNEKYAQTNMQWLWPTHELIISGPGENAQQSKSVTFLHTDEAHRWNQEYPGAMASLDNRMGLRWDRHALHGTTAADAGSEVDVLYHRGRQNEWHIRCLHCDGMIEPLWEDSAREKYNGERVFHFTDSQSETETLDSIRIVCPHCQKEIRDTFKNRAEMDEGAHYIAANPSADIANNSFRWNAFGPRWKPWRDLLAVYLKAIHSAKLGDLAPYEDWVRKQEVRSWRNEYPMLGVSAPGDYKRADVQHDSAKLRTCSFDKQQGRQGEGLHFWGQVDEWDLDGNSRRIEYAKLATKGDCRAFQLRHGVKDENTAIDFADDQDRYVLAMCAEFHWLAMRSTGEESFSHTVYARDGKTPPVQVEMPWSERRPENPLAGKQTGRIVVSRGSRLPQGWAISILWSKPTIYPQLYRLKNGEVPGRKYGVASDIGKEYTEQLHSYVPMLEVDKKSRLEKKTVWQKVKPDDHAFITSAQSLVLAQMAGYYPAPSLEPVAA